MKVALYGRQIAEAHLPFLQQLITKIAGEKVEILIYELFKQNLQQTFSYEANYPVFSSCETLPDDVDCLFSIGGDGAILDTLLLIQNKGIPVLGLNFGRLGFLSSVQHSDLEWALNAWIEKRFELDRRTLLEVRNPLNIFQPHHNIALNEVTISKKDSSSMIQIHTWVNDECFNIYWADGLIIATPTGSTGYSMSCNGPIITPDTPGILLTPIAPHNLNMRPVVIPDSAEVKLKVVSRDSAFLLSLDSRSYSLAENEEITIRKSLFNINFVKLQGMSYVQSLRNKLLWGLDKRN
ncbi:MAG: NAD kinase [Flavobacteriales bacterium]|nr:NAD kinase [Flavobacteriales bacterium]